MITKVKKWGNSLAVRVPKDIAREARLYEGSTVSFSTEGNAVILRRQKKPRYTLKELMKRFDKKNKPKKFEWGKPMGKEIW